MCEKHRHIYPVIAAYSQFQWFLYLLRKGENDYDSVAQSIMNGVLKLKLLNSPKGVFLLVQYPRRK